MVDLELNVADTKSTITFDQVAPAIPIIDTEENLIKLIGNLVPCEVKDIWNYKFCINAYSRSENLYRNINCNIYKLFQLMSTSNEVVCGLPSDEYEQQQIIFVHFSGEIMGNVLDFAIENNLKPTFVLHCNRNSIFEKFCRGQEITFGYLLSKPVQSKALRDRICKFFETVFEKNFHWCEVGVYLNINYTVTDFYNNYTEIIINHNVYVPVIGGIANV